MSFQSKIVLNTKSGNGFRLSETAHLRMRYLDARQQRHPMPDIRRTYGHDFIGKGGRKFSVQYRGYISTLIITVYKESLCSRDSSERFPRYPSSDTHGLTSEKMLRTHSFIIRLDRHIHGGQCVSVETNIGQQDGGQYGGYE
jgi:hypothetical protein